MSDRGAVAITGANGYVGTVLRQAFTKSGYRVLALQRTGSSDCIPYTLEDGPAVPLPGDVRAVVHCAYDLRARTPADVERINLGGTRKLIEKIGDIPLVLISSMSAYQGTNQIYGRNKLACEDLVAAAGGTSLRLGLVYGGTDGGMIGSLLKLSRLPLIPVLCPDSYQYTVHYEDMAQCIISAVERPTTHRSVGVANPRRVPFSEILSTLRATTTDRPLRGLPTPSSWIYRGLRAVEATGLRPPLRADSMLGLIRPAPDVPHVEEWTERGLTLRDFNRSSTQ
ncbi:Uncharacterized conserved protein [Mycobacteroides abscessus subsp. abscessus]|nr:Uncharacterized conserved protein [Mycobacteroides abscessus subsp. abscessus]